MPASNHPSALMVTLYHKTVAIGVFEIKIIIEKLENFIKE